MERKSLTAVERERERERVILLENKEETLFNSLTQVKANKKEIEKKENHKEKCYL